jgi:hypothetical protein
MVLNAFTHRSMSAVECEADICTRMRALPFGTTGKLKPIT